MATQICFTYGSKDYVLEFTRSTVSEMESRGFVATELTEKPMSMLPELFAGAFLAHHRYTKREVIDEIYSKMTDKAGLIGKLGEMYNEPIMTLIQEPEADEGNVVWTANE